jgi:hypothetical protein
MMALLLLLLQFTYPGAAGIELDPSDPQGTNFEAMGHCTASTPWTFSPQSGPSGGCRVKFTPGTYYIRKPIALPNGVVAVDFSGVTLIPCAEMGYMVGVYTMGPAPAVLVEPNLQVDTSQPCGTYQPPIRQVWRSM